ncbi:unnamed protein product [Bursaphelenchus okinawaensis]|uniref:Uncharacterized protein n=1 Tax=Bursaphelenchus okinawaensis TaxID=465554 RepID=A0A811JQS9_9BILA|nr:unnamed protein product [Bursaphelenchus okinawaensis]CAG9078760.1 unnamed protein product [Bursaphelenchus okinawaensis]
MHKLQIYTTKGTLLDTVGCFAANTVKDLVENAVTSKKLRFEEVCSLHKLGEDGKWIKIKWKSEVSDVPTVYKVIKDSLKCRLKHRVRVVDYDGEELALIPTKSGTIVRNIVNEIVSTLGVNMKNVFFVEVFRNKILQNIRMDQKILREERLVITLDLLERDVIRIENGEPILPNCLTVLKLDEMLLKYEHKKIDNNWTRSAASELVQAEVVARLKAGELMTDAEKLLISKCMAPPLQQHCMKRNAPWRNESRLYLANLFQPYPQLHIPDFVSNQDTRVEISVFERVMIKNLTIFKRKRRSAILRLMKTSTST